MIDRARLRGALLAMLVGGFAVHVSCGYRADLPLDGPSRALDQACSSGGCVMTGSARLGSGPVPGSIGILLGPDPGSVTIPLSYPAPPSGYEGHLELLATGHGSFRVTVPGCIEAEGGDRIVAPGDYGWVGLFCDSGSLQPGTAAITIAGAAGSTLELADVRYVNRNDDPGCE